uniref:Predicted arabinose efflux permease, MFS family n=1 Tax=Candidatus Kentrum sp. SD TaxID=2126332 RepID=A0A450Y5Y4_9GAMM|nr:MAG: Predicted arabinose efflux permease, MFS family [Candidatus Kentron sp. SD]VFK40592.1 MAG: Predicted arabinose efflux permease, MFS family [Candidatus Kentron sp. SD]VFK80228.1 MAG: Predicted arabinose efflux permease, MFS family [Candidatus Kentron sp. SD]
MTHKRKNKGKNHADAGPNTGMTSPERRAVAALTAVFSIRMFGLFMILPVFTLYGEDRYTGYTATLAGLAIGIYGLTQALLQIPFGMLSDRLGRKPVIIAGLLIFIVGSVVAAASDSIMGVIIGRALQGAGAIAAAVMALMADLTRKEQHTKAMATFGASIGMVFVIALMAGPALGHFVGLSGLFQITALLGLVGIAVLYFSVPEPAAIHFHQDAEASPAQFSDVLKDFQLLRLDLGIFMLHLILVAGWVVLPLTLRDAGLAVSEHWKIYVLVLLVSVVLMVPFIMASGKYQRTKPIFLGAVFALGIYQLGLFGYRDNLPFIVAMMMVFFTAFNILEANLPSLVSRFAPPEKKGTALGIYSTSQFLGAFAGGLAGGWLLDNHGAQAVFIFCAVMAGIWFFSAVTMKDPHGSRAG